VILLDTNVLSELMRPVPDLRLRPWLSSARPTPLATSAVSIAEIVFGLSRLPDGRRQNELAERFELLLVGPPALPVLGLDEQAARLSGEFRAVRESRGLGAAVSDMMIAGIAVANGARLATRNTRDFTGLPLTVVDPWA
jgi:predicted nucleic acid-binding protein